MGYYLNGNFLEACDCQTVCPCWLDDDPDNEECTGLFVWDIDSGAIDGTDVSGLRVASVSFHTGNRRESHQRTVVFVDDRADDGQVDLLVDVFTGQRGGTLAELADLLAELAATKPAKIDVEYSEAGTRVSVGRAVEAEMTPAIGAFGRPITLVDSALGRVFGSPAQIGYSKRLRIDIPEGDFDLDVKGLSANAGAFDYRG